MIRPPRTGFRWIRSAVEVGNGDMATVVFAIGDSRGDALVRPGGVVMRLVFGQDGAQWPSPRIGPRSQLAAQGAGEALSR